VTFSVLFVCTGNICRSPLAEFLFRARVPPDAPIAVSSAGTRGLAGYGIDAPSALALRELGVDAEGHVARRLRPAFVERADLVLTADTDHRATIVRRSPLAFRRVFTMREFGRLGAALPPLEPLDADTLRDRVTEIAERRGHVDPPPPGGDDIGDPFGAGLEPARQAARDVSSAVDAIVAALGLPRQS
jgi:protein-tyrosine-phosphatase